MDRSAPSRSDVEEFRRQLCASPPQVCEKDAALVHPSNGAMILLATKDAAP
jgi:hypothetical protein